MPSGSVMGINSTDVLSLQTALLSVAEQEAHAGFAEGQVSC